jgi:RNA polymerase sigma factor (TIGR02999 family)
VSGEVGAVTQLLKKWRQGDRQALDEVTRIVYAELRQLAASYLRRERSHHTLQPTALVAEAYLRLCGDGAVTVENRSHFLAIAARTMRRVLIEHARKRRAEKRGEDPIAVELDDALAGPDRSETLVALDEALSELAQIDERKARIVELVYFGGMKQEEIAEVMQIHYKTVARDVRMARAWLKSRILQE